MDVTLSGGALSAARRFLKGFSAATRKKGEAYFRQGRVQALTEDEGGEWSAKVRGGKVYGVTLQWNEEEWPDWEGFCDCPVEIDCKHIYAAMCRLLEDAELAQVQEKAQARRATALQPGRKTAAAGKGQKEPAKSSSKSAATDSFALVVEEKLGRALTADEKTVARKIAGLVKAAGPNHEVPERALVGLYRPAKDWGWNRFTLWPSPPASAWEAWLYLAHFLAGNGQDWPRFLERITTVEEVRALVAPWERARSIEQWQHRLLEVQHTTSKMKTPTLDLRVVFERQSALLESTENGVEWTVLKSTRFAALDRAIRYGENKLTPEARSLWFVFSGTSYDHHWELRYDSPANAAKLQQLVRNSLLAPRLVTEARVPFTRPAEPLRWEVQAPETPEGDYRFQLVLQDGSPLPAPLLVLPGSPTFYVNAEAIFHAPPLGELPLDPAAATHIPAPALETRSGVTLLARAGVELPPRLSARVQQHRAKLVIQAGLITAPYGGGERLQVRMRAEWGEGVAATETLKPEGWVPLDPVKAAAAAQRAAQLNPEETVVLLDRTRLDSAGSLLAGLELSWNAYEGVWERKVVKKFPEQFSQWLLTLPEDVELLLDAELASLREGPLHGSVNLDVEPAGVDWFDLSVNLSVPDLDLTPEELQALLSANGGWVRLGKAGWRRLALQLTEEEDRGLADLGLSPRDLASGEKQRLHALQLAHAGADRMLTVDRAAELRARADELKARVSPEVPAVISASLRPYQVEGFHFLAYLSTNRFGGLLADDMGLGKTLQTLTWLMWLRSQPDFKGAPSLVVCPKSVMDNWRSEAGRFAAGLRVTLWRGLAEKDLPRLVREECDLLVINFAQLRNLKDSLVTITWLAVILDEAQAIKNPDAQSSRAACALQAEHRLALTGTPIENRLLDLWSIMAFAMPGMLGPRARFGKVYDQKDDPLARRRLAARTRPFLLRRTKEQVASDLPARVEEDLLCEIEGAQSTLYQAELKRARKALLGLETDRELDKVRFHILTSLLRLRQICCHPGLVDANAIDKPSAKTEALLDLLEPLMEEGRKVLVFSQFVGVIELLQKAIEARGWPIYILTGQTEDRGDLIAQFQAHEGCAVFLLSLKASSFGLNLTAASYVVLYDPWWNPAVENQAIDRTHRIGQTNTVFAYRLLVKGSIEEKIRALQKQKRALADDLLGEEAFARALTLADLRNLLDDPDPQA